MNKISPEARAARIAAANVAILAALAKRPHTREEIIKLSPANKNETSTILSEMHYGSRIMYNQTDKTVELFRVAQL